MMGLGYKEILLVVGVLFVLFGARRIPTLARDLARSIVSFKKGLREVDVRGDIREAFEASPERGA